MYNVDGFNGNHIPFTVLTTLIIAYNFPRWRHVLYEVLCMCLVDGSHCFFAMFPKSIVRGAIFKALCKMYSIGMQDLHELRFVGYLPRVTSREFAQARATYAWP